MSESKSTPKTRAADLSAARKAGGRNEQSHLMARLKAVMKLPAKPVKKPAKR